MRGLRKNAPKVPRKARVNSGMRRTSPGRSAAGRGSTKRCQIPNSRNSAARMPIATDHAARGLPVRVSIVPASITSSPCPAIVAMR